MGETRIGETSGSTTRRRTGPAVALTAMLLVGVGGGLPACNNDNSTPDTARPPATATPPGTPKPSGTQPSAELKQAFLMGGDWHTSVTFADGLTASNLCDNGAVREGDPDVAADSKSWEWPNGIQMSIGIQALREKISADNQAAIVWVNDMGETGAGVLPKGTTFDVTPENGIETFGVRVGPKTTCYDVGAVSLAGATVTVNHLLSAQGQHTTVDDMNQANVHVF